MTTETAATATAAPSDYAVVAAPETVRIERVLPGSVERAWAWLVEPDKRRLWFADGTIEPRVGGVVALTWRNSTLSAGDDPAPEGFGGETHGRGVVTAWEPPTRLGITWAHSGGPETEAVFDLSPHGDGVSLVITHRRLVSDRLVVGVSAGWHSHLAVLEARLLDREPPRFWATFARMGDAYRARYGL